MMTPSARADLAQREEDIQRGKTVELLRRAGKEMYDNPIVNTAIGFTPVLGDVQAAGETMSALERGAPWQETAGYAVGMLPFVPMIGKTVWHGSPHTFDKFDLSKIGTGEGVQAYGHGLYLAEARPVAEEYTTVGGKGDFVRFGENVYPIASEQGQMLSDVQKMGRKMAVEKYPNQADFIKTINPDNIKYEGGSLYKVDLPDEQIAKMLDWDKPLSEQPEAYAAIQKYAQETQYNPENALKSLEGKSGGEAYSMWSDPQYVSQFLNEQGVPGIQYLDQASRGAGDGTRNYVVFSDEIPQILERNGQPVAQALRNYAPKIDEATGLPLNEQGMVTVYHHTNPEAAKQIAETGRLRSAGEPDVYVTSWDKPDTGYGESVVPIQVDPSVLRLDDEFPSGRMDFAIPVGKSGEFIFKGNK